MSQPRYKTHPCTVETTDNLTIYRGCAGSGKSFQMHRNARSPSQTLPTGQFDSHHDLAIAILRVAEAGFRAVLVEECPVEWLHGLRQTAKGLTGRLDVHVALRA